MVESPLTEARLTRRIAGFTGHLRRAGFAIGPAETADAMRVAAAALAAGKPVRPRLKALLSAGPDDWDRFDALFAAYWFAAGRPAAEGEMGATLIAGRVAGEASEAASGASTGAAAEADAPADGGASGAEALMQVDFADFARPDEIAAAERHAGRLARALRRRRSRRLRAAPSGSRIDLRRTIRASLGKGGELADLRFRRRRLRPMRLFILIDVSGSMKPYARVFLQYVRGLIGQALDAEAFLVHTRLVPATRALRAPTAREAMARLGRVSEGFGGGTRLGAALRTFNADHARRVDSRSVVMILSDGYDSGPETLFGAEIARLAARAGRLVWLNPLKGRAGFRPVTLAMLAALDHIDHFAAANTLASLARLSKDFERL